ncbi:MAG: hypothetical protein AB1461_06835 [Thermodesulfobacteriota bacterium]
MNPLTVRMTLPFLLVAAFFVLATAGCTATRSLIAACRSTDSFLPLEADGRIFYEPGAEANAALLAPLLPEAVAKVEAAHGLPFHDPAAVHVCASAESCYRFTGSRAPAIVTGKLFLSPLLFSAGRPVDRYLVHELSHLHLQQRLGTLQCIRLPVWFKEGLAEVVSGGATSSRMADRQAYEAIAAGRCFTPDAGGNVFTALLFPRYGSYWGISQPLFYRQCLLFVDFLQGSDETSFRALMTAIQQDESFSAAWSMAYRQSLPTMWQQFVQQAKKKAARHAG